MVERALLQRQCLGLDHIQNILNIIFYETLFAYRYIKQILELNWILNTMHWNEKGG